MGGVTQRSISVGTDTCFLGQNAGKQFVDSATFNAASLAPVNANVANEIQSIAIAGGPTGGSFKLSWGGNESTVAVPFNGDTSSVKAALNSIAALNGKVQVTGKAGGPYFVHFIGSGLAGTDVSPITATSVALTGGLLPGLVITEQRKGGTTSADPRILVGSSNFPGTIVKKVTVDGRGKVQEYDGSGDIFGIVDGVEEFISNTKSGDRDVPVYRAFGLVVDARKIKNYVINKNAIDTWAGTRGITIKHG